MDRNKFVDIPKANQTNVALHPEGVDRNFWREVLEMPRYVALHPEGVDRNFEHFV